MLINKISTMFFYRLLFLILLKDKSMNSVLLLSTRLARVSQVSLLTLSSAGQGIVSLYFSPILFYKFNFCIHFKPFYVLKYFILRTKIKLIYLFIFSATQNQEPSAGHPHQGRTDLPRRHRLCGRANSRGFVDKWQCGAEGRREDHNHLHQLPHHCAYCQCQENRQRHIHADDQEQEWCRRGFLPAHCPWYAPKTRKNITLEGIFRLIWMRFYKINDL